MAKPNLSGLYLSGLSLAKPASSISLKLLPQITDYAIKIDSRKFFLAHVLFVRVGCHNDVQFVIYIQVKYGVRSPKFICTIVIIG